MIAGNDKILEIHTKISVNFSVQRTASVLIVTTLKHYDTFWQNI